jgi:cellobiose transport system permease protein
VVSTRTTGPVAPFRAGAGRPLPRPSRRPLRTYWRQYLAISPFFFVFTGFSLIPVIFTLYIGFQHWDGLGPMKFVGLQQFRYLVKDHTFWVALENTVVIWVLATFPMLFISLVLAVMINSVKRFSTGYRIAYFIPNVTSLVAVAIFFFAIFSSQFGIANASLHAVHLPEVPWLVNFWTIKVVIAMLMTWQWTGYNMIIYLAGLQAIPGELYEAARIDGANAVQMFWRITVPLLRPIILFTVIVSTVTGLQSFTEPQVMFGSTAAMNPDSGGPGQAGLTLMLYFYQQAFDNHDYGYGAAIVWALFLLIMAFVVINWRIVARRNGGAA